MCKKSTSINIKVLDSYICEECEKTICTMNSDDIEYENYSMIFKKIWHEFLISI